jgi:hypothetical protein
MSGEPGGSDAWMMTFVVSISKKWVPFRKAVLFGQLLGEAANRMLPPGSSAAGASARVQGVSLLVPQAEGTSGPCVQVLVELLNIAVCVVPEVVPPKTTTVPSGRST